jgi:hypothetical protein
MLTAARPAAARLNTFAVMHVRHALQHAVATGVCSAYRVAA